MSKRNEKRNEILAYITKKVAECGYVPSVREICNDVGLNSPATVHYHLKQLDEAGLIAKEPNKKRCLRLMNTPRPEDTATDSFFRVPVLGRVAAGLPILAEENVEDYIEVPQNLARGRDLFALYVRGDSMINAGIHDGDIIIVNSTSVAENGDIVVALLEEEATVKRFFKEDRAFRLQPENDAYEPIISTNVRILGKVVALHRYYE